MREIKFRGKRVGNGEWVYGYYLVHEGNNEHKIHYRGTIGMATAIVEKETVGQYTDLKDKNGKEIYEGNKVLHWNHDFTDSAPMIVMWCPQKVGYVLSQEGLVNDGGLWMRDWNPDRCEVIENIVDVPEFEE